MIKFAEQDLDRFLAEDPGGPFVMLNLLRFAEGGWEKYRKYAAGTREVTAELGVEVVYFGRSGPALIAEPGQSWDATLLVRYPSRQVFAQLIRDPRYQAVSHFRTEALTESVLQPTVPVG